jgi:hypothetical protein
MARKLARLTAIGVKTAKPGRYGDGAGLYLLVRSPQRRFWIFRYTMGGRTREAGLGPAAGPDGVSLAEAREKAATLRRQVKAGIDPLEERQEKIARAAADAQGAKAKGVTFRKTAELYVATHEPDWRSDVHRKQWIQSLRDYCFPHLGELPVQAIEKFHVLAVLQPLWREKPETASRVRGRIERILDFAEASGWRSGDNPARWRRLAVLLGGRRKLGAPAFGGRGRADSEVVSPSSRHGALMDCRHTLSALGVSRSPWPSRSPGVGAPAARV